MTQQQAQGIPRPRSHPRAPPYDAPPFFVETVAAGVDLRRRVATFRQQKAPSVATAYVCTYTIGRYFFRSQMNREEVGRRTEKA